VGQTEALEHSVLEYRELFGTGVVDPPRSVCRYAAQETELPQAIDNHGQGLALINGGWFVVRRRMSLTFLEERGAEREPAGSSGSDCGGTKAVGPPPRGRSSSTHGCCGSKGVGALHAAGNVPGIPVSLEDAMERSLTDYEAGLDLAGSGMAYVCIPREDLAARRFDRGWLVFKAT
jgi:hypothetical protein